MASNCKKFVLSVDEASENKEAGIESSETVADAQVFTLKQGTQEFVTPNSGVDSLVSIGSGEIEVNDNSTENTAPLECTKHSLRLNGANLVSISTKKTAATFSILELKTVKAQTWRNFSYSPSRSRQLVDTLGSNMGCQLCAMRF